MKKSEAQPGIRVMVYAPEDATLHLQFGTVQTDYDISFSDSVRVLMDADASIRRIHLDHLDFE
jgi:hypothetical protein